MRPAITDQRRRPRQDRSRRTVEAILDAAAGLFESQGYTATTMTAIADAAGVGIASLYQWFPTKDDILLGLAERHLADVTPRLAALAAELRETVPPLEVTVRRFVELAVELNADGPRFHRELFEYCPRTPPIDELLGAVERAVADELVWHLRRLGDAGDDLALRAEIVVAAVDAVVHRVVIARPAGRERDQAVDQAQQLVLRYLGMI